jgi:HEAT repeat protein
LTKDEYKKIDNVIDRFIAYDTGKLKGTEGKKALDEFNRLGPESIFNLIDGLNRAANMEDSCPAVIIAKRVATILTTTDDLALLGIAKDSIGADVKAKRHLGVLQDLQFHILVRKSTLQRRGVTLNTAKTPATMSIGDLEKGIAKESGNQLKGLLAETEKRNGAKAIDLLVIGMANPNAEIAKLSQGLLAKNLQHQPGDVLKAMLKHDRRDVRIAAAQAIGAKKLKYGAELIGLLADGDDDVRQAGRRALVQISGGVDHGPSPDASSDERESARARWREWWARQK